jgi:hypothetical protein
MKTGILLHGVKKAVSIIGTGFGLNGLPFTRSLILQAPNPFIDMNTTYSRLYIEYLQCHAITNKYFHISFERMHTTSGTAVFERKENGELFKCKFIIRKHFRDTGFDITLISLKHQFSYQNNGTIKRSHFLTSETDLFQEKIMNLLDIA